MIHPSKDCSIFINARPKILAKGKMKKLFLSLLLIILLNIFLNIWLILFNHKVPKSDDYYTRHNYYIDERTSGGEFDLLRAWGQTDSQWYLRIAAKGYGKPTDLTLASQKMEGLTYAFFPLYPLTIRLFAFFTNGNFELAAFILNNLLIITNFVSIWFVVKKIYSEKYAFIAAFLVVLFPFSI